MQVVGVVPIFMSAGAAVLPTVVAAATSVVAILFKPRELLALCRRRPAAMGVTGLSVLLAVAGVVWWLEAPAKARVVARKEKATDWAQVARDILAQAPLHPVAAVGAGGGSTTTATTTTATTTTTTTGATVVTGGTGLISQDFTRSRYQGGGSPAKLVPTWKYQPEGTMFISSPAVANGKVFVAGCAADLGGYTGILACLDAQSGKKIWEVVSLNDDVMKPFFSSPAVTPDGKYMIIGQGLHEDRECLLLCFETDTGKLHWAAKSLLHIESSPAIYGDMVVVGDGAIEGRDGLPIGDPGYVFAVRISDGKELWRQALNDPESEPAIDAEGMVYIGSGFNGSAVAAIRSETDAELKGRGLSRVAWKTPVDYPVVGPVTLAGEMVIVGGGNGDLVHSNANARGQVLALDRKTGAILWKTAVADSVLGSMSYRNGVVIAPARTGEVLALSAKDGTILWRTHISGNSPVIAGCPFTESRIYALSSDGYLAALDPKNGHVIEKLFVNDAAKPGSGLSTSSPVVALGKIYVGTETGGMRCVAGTEVAK